ncbi:hypothetical protein TSUD_288980 [Trifolium subterraneum]|uniref:Polyadenylate-binding protein n=1 Tax=Trifolium subterraneum TaxID=3900 RepID=A0A2Z6M9R8_TRISU|nr:hypothetical protein TSUD_288980 [Trifolium subterraneum]
MAAISSSKKAVLVPAALNNNGRFENASLYIGDLEGNVNEAQLYDLFGQIAQVVSIRVCRDHATQSSLGYAYVNLSNEHDDNKALHDTFASFGTVLSCKIALDSNGQSRGYGFVQFDTDESAQNAIEKLDGMLINDKKVYVGHFIRQQERSRNGSPKFTNIYVKNLSETYTDEDLKQLFNTYGVITSAVVMKDENGNSKCFGFVNFQNPDSAAVAAQFSQFQTLGGIVGYHSGVPSITPQQFYFGQHTPDLMALQPTGNGFQQQFMSGGVGSSIATNFIMPYHHQRKSHPKHRMTGRRVGNFQHVQQNQLLPRNSNQRVRYNGRNGNDPSVVDPKGLVGQMMVPPVVVAPPTDNQLHGALSNKSLSSTLASSPPEIQHMMLREHLFPLVSRLTSNYQAAKVTEMLLEMDQSEVIHLIESPEELKIKVSEAMKVLRDAPSSETGDGIISE